MLCSHMGDWAMVLANLHTKTGTVDGRGIAMFVQDSSQPLGHFLYGLIFPDKRVHVLKELFKAGFCEIAHGLGSTCRP